MSYLRDEDETGFEPGPRIFAFLLGSLSGAVTGLLIDWIARLIWRW